MKISTTSIFSTGLLVLGSLALRANAAPVGMIAHVKGQVTAIQNGKKSPVRLLGRIEPDTVIVAGPNSNAVIVLFSNGARFQLGAGTQGIVNPSNVLGAKKLADLSGPSAGAAKLLGTGRVGAIMARQTASFERLIPSSNGYLVGDAPRFDWNPISGAANYSFALFDSSDNVLWSLFTDEARAAYPANTPPLPLKQPLLWKQTGYSASGKPIFQGSRWGIITILSAEDAQTLEAIATDLQNQAKANPADKTPLLLLAETYRSYGVVNRALELFDSEDLKKEPGVADAKNALIKSLSPFINALWAQSQGKP